MGSSLLKESAATELTPACGIRDAARRVEAGERRLGLHGLTPQALGFFLARLRGMLKTSLVVVTRSLKEARALAGAVELFSGPVSDAGRVRLLTCWEPLWGRRLTVEEDPAMSRLGTLAALHHTAGPHLVVATLAGLLQKAIPEEALDSHSLYLVRGEEVDREELIQLLTVTGYSRTELVGEPGDFSVRGAVLDLFPPLYQRPLRLEFYGDEVESVRHFSPETQRSAEELEDIIISPASEAVLTPGNITRAREELYRLGLVRSGTWLMDLETGGHFPSVEPLLPFLYDGLANPLDYLPADSLFILSEPDEMEDALFSEHERLGAGIREIAGEKGPGLEMDENLLDPGEIMESLAAYRTLAIAGEHDPPPADGAGALDFSVQDLSGLKEEMARRLKEGSPFELLAQRVKKWHREGFKVILVARSRERAERMEGLFLGYDLSPGRENFEIVTGSLPRGFLWHGEGVCVISEEELFAPKARRVRRSIPKGIFLSSFRDLKPGDPVVHRDFGIGLFRDLKTLEVDGARGDFLHIEYREGDRLYVPVDRLRLVQKYLGAGEAAPRLDRLGAKSWDAAKKKTKKAVRKLAEELLNLYAKRLANPGFAYSAPDDIFERFEDGFPFEETPDQTAAVTDVLGDMAETRPMDRLICGDVGFGKTEVAIRAAFNAVFDGKQVAVVAPTTVLVEQHLLTFTERFKDYPVRVAGLSRLKTQARQKRVIKELEEGRIDLVVGTHRLLSGDVKFSDLGLLIIDEEHRFGVAHKEKIKRLRSQVDVLALSATPIPRTLSLSLSGLRDLSVIETPPLERRAIITEVVSFDKRLIKEAVEFELNRGGQVFFVHNRIKTISRMADMIRDLAPGARVAHAHGQMPERELEKVMLDFVNRRIDVLVTTSIIESGLDIPSANTLIVDRADKFGLAQLHQIRGRVGRSPVQAYAYLMVPDSYLVSPRARKRLKTLIDFTHLGAGFKIALHDLQLRGAGEVLGAAQSGHAARVGYELYMDMVEREVRRIKGEDVKEEVEPEISLGVEAMLPESYLPDRSLRLLAYKRLALAANEETLAEVADELKDRYGPLPEPALRLIEVAKIKMLMAELRVAKAEYGKGMLGFTFGPRPAVDPEKLADMVAREPGRFRLTPEGKLFVRLKKQEPHLRFEEAKKVLLSIRESCNLTPTNQ